MMKGFGIYSVYCQALLLLGLFTFTVSAFSTPALFGIDPQEKGYYESKKIMCKDGSKSFSRDRLNDDFCDCADGTDEPGTSACPEGKFYCTNTGHAPILMSSSRVNDGICDCCDGSDEYDGKIRCPNTCRKAGKAVTGKLLENFLVNKERFSIDKQEREHAKRKFLSEETTLTSLKQDDEKLNDTIQKLKDLKLLPLLELVIVASILVFSQRCFCCKRGQRQSRRRRP